MSYLSALRNAALSDHTTSLSALTDVDIVQDNLNPSLFPGVPSTVLIHSGFAQAQALVAPAILTETRRLISTKGASTVTLV